MSEKITPIPLKIKKLVTYSTFGIGKNFLHLSRILYICDFTEAFKIETVT